MPFCLRTHLMNRPVLLLVAASNVSIPQMRRCSTPWWILDATEWIAATQPFHPTSVRLRSLSRSCLTIDERENVCNYDFLADKNYFLSNYSRFVVFYQMDYAPLIMKWYFNRTQWEIFGTHLMQNSTNYCLRTNLDKYYEEDQGMLKCLCKSGYEGNPCILEGCQGMYTPNFNIIYFHLQYIRKYWIQIFYPIFISFFRGPTSDIMPRI